MNVTSGVDKLIYVGVITSPHGIKGNVNVKTFTTLPTDLTSFENIFSEDGISWKLKLVSVKSDCVIAS